MVQVIHEGSFHPVRSRIAGRFLFAGSTILLLPFILLTPAVAQQADSPTNAQNAPQAAAAPAVPSLNEALHPALQQVGSALNQVQIDHWKLSRELKEQLRSDADSIQQDLASPLPGLFQAAQQSPAELGPQLSVMHNVDALYDVLVRITTAASIAGGKTDAAILDNAVQQLESARKTAATQLLQTASSRDLEISRLQARLQSAQMSGRSANGPSKTIVVDNRIGHRTKHHKAVPHRKTAKPTSPQNTGAGAPVSNPNHQ